MTKPTFKPIEMVEGAWLSGRIEPISTISGPLGSPVTTKVIKFKADMRDIVELDKAQMDELIEELTLIKEKMVEMDLEIHPSETL